MITAPEGWSAKFSKEAGKENVLIVTAPASSAKMMTRATADNSTDIAILATSGKYAMIAKIQVSIKNRTDYKADLIMVKTLLSAASPSTTKFIQMLTYKYWMQQMPMWHLTLTLVLQ